MANYFFAVCHEKARGKLLLYRVQKKKHTANYFFAACYIFIVCAHNKVFICRVPDRKHTTNSQIHSGSAWYHKFFYSMVPQELHAVIDPITLNENFNISTQHRARIVKGFSATTAKAVTSKFSIMSSCLLTIGTSWICHNHLLKYVMHTRNILEDFGNHKKLTLQCMRIRPCQSKKVLEEWRANMSNSYHASW